MDIGSPVTNKHYIAQPHGEIYGLDHSLERFDLAVDTKLRPETDVPGLYLTGQDTMSVGVLPSLVSGVFAAGAVIGRPLAIVDLQKLHKRSSRDQGAKGKKVQ